jgi:hypothetical protein
MVCDAPANNLSLQVQFWHDYIEKSWAWVKSRIRKMCNDETSARVNGKKQWEWVFQNAQVCFHVIRPSRGGDVIEELSILVIDKVCLLLSRFLPP